MAGILDNKERVMDFIVTDEGKRQAGIGEMKIRYASFTDQHTFYDTSGSLTNPKLAADASDRIYFESFSRYQDVVVPELEAGYSLRPFRTKDFTVAGGTVASGTFNPGFVTSTGGTDLLTGSALTAATSKMLDGIAQNFEDLRIVKTIDEFSFYQAVEISPSTGSFSIDNSTNYGRAGVGKGEINLDDVPSIFSDRRFADFPNFKYLPPENEPKPGEKVGTLLGDYPRLNEQETLTLAQLQQELSGKPVQEFQFSKTSRANNIVVQFFEQSQSGVDKLSVVDFGEFDDDEPLSQGKRVLFVGKIKRDSFGAETFVNIFTVVID
jgi:hypothetical protein